MSQPAYAHYPQMTGSSGHSSGRRGGNRLALLARALRRPGLALVMAFCVLGAADGQAAATITIAPHRAVYALELGHARIDSNVTQAEGRLEYEWDDVCDGWTVRQRTLLTLVHRTGQAIQSNWVINSWESKDGLKYRFFVRRFQPGGMVESIRGHAELDGPGQGGRAVFYDPEERVIDLPTGTLFPTNYSLEMMTSAEEDRLPMWRIMFDGFGDEELLGVSAARVSALAAGEAASLDSAMLADQPSWRVRLAYFPLERQTPEPDREQGFRVFANGIVDELVIDYGDFSIDAALEDLTSLPHPTCQ
jgi:hypothetical protein